MEILKKKGADLLYKKKSNTLVKLNHNTDSISRVCETSRYQSTRIQITRNSFTVKNKKLLIFIKFFVEMHSELVIFKKKSMEFKILKII